MNVALWVLQIVLGLAFAVGGFLKATQPKAKLEAQMPWAHDFSAGAIKAIGTVEMLGAAGLIVPAATGILPVLTPLAATGLALTMVAAAIVHLRRGEYAGTMPSLVLLVLSVVVAWGRFGPYSF